MIRIGKIRIKVGLSALVGLYLVFVFLSSGGKREGYEPTPLSSLPSLIETDVLIIGAGIAGLTAAATLREQDVKFKILEASRKIGGRLQTTHQFGGIGFDVGSTLVYEPAWPNIIARKDVNATTVRFSSKKLPCYGQWVFENYTWNDFVMDHMQPERGEIVHSCFVESVSYPKLKKSKKDEKQQEDDDAPVAAICGKHTFHAKHIIVTSPLNVLKSGDMKFNPPLPKALVQDHPATVMDGIKVIMEFKWPFYPKYVDMGWYQPKDPPGLTKFYGADLLQPHSRNYVIVGDILGSHATQYYDMTNASSAQFVLDVKKPGWKKDWTEKNFTNHLLKILDRQMVNYFLQEDVVSANLIKMQIVYWNKIKSIRGGSIQPFDCAAPPVESSEGDDDDDDNGDESGDADDDKPKICGGTQLINGKLILAGEAFPYISNPGEIGWVHNAALSGRHAAGQVISKLLPKGGKKIASKLKLPQKTDWQSPWLNPKLMDQITKEEFAEAAAKRAELIK
ncbi:unnamed protein product [Cylindrotheca closterium]|uniref:Amine oxidase domain-containing protein n=1 Tax=Cylindrotheca closterium TaxID=2856 RepID=A0AAD2FZI9_9STRA|nr:unnamed protein product [Cylindrotheca closterium]